jgi:proteasome accessory factor B
MVGMDALAKSERLVKLQSLLLAQRSGFTSEELAVRCGVCRRTIQRDLRSLETMGLPLVEEGGRYSLLPDGLMPPLRLRLEEATSLFIGARLLSRYSDEHNPWVVGALEKLATVVPASVGGHLQRCADAARRDGDERYSNVFRIVTRAWARRRKVRIWYRSIESANVHDYVVAPYFIEPSAVGFAAYVIGHSTYFNALRTFKIERIERAEELQEEFQPPPGFDGPTWLSQAWGVMAGGAIEQVVLRFAPRVARRVHETIWHPSQQLVDEDGGGVRCTFALSEPREMLPWLRGWGADVEVVAPPWLRARVAADLAQAVETYRMKE